MTRLVIASGNAGKLREFRALLEPLSLQVISQAELAIAPAEEPHPTFIENALAKARHASAASGLPALADDSGLSCPSLGGAPGVRSARFAGDAASDADNNAALLRALAAHTDRRGHYTCVLVALRSPDDPEPVIAEGHWHGAIVAQARGSHGFGYDPHFFLPDLGCTAAELEPAHKNRVSHRGLAMADFAQRLAARWGL
ncbi:MAG: RdgB/HAM1 family non-canonical purine NTP pyrophosphatase [Burkholderiaceae bacterium]|jgi:XTP/dITP diphosphohydrolase|nr:RdgB/HAM1 family non-canonical purine NTP pyrophosphatase [Burkholderiaceae bacterium]